MGNQRYRTCCDGWHQRALANFSFQHAHGIIGLNSLDQLSMRILWGGLGPTAAATGHQVILVPTRLVNIGSKYGSAVRDLSTIGRLWFSRHITSYRPFLPI
ncbi:unnamed protein product [Nesidiocoris tenuis]|uniref:Uncharacterized protein n=1 Tax=Nesidiocoris tenuis TaxID=355587 RepID=A0A6H5H0J3_9HEMI|nr:unnamed protein product [Nesidiocoris tenuis]